MYDAFMLDVTVVISALAARMKRVLLAPLVTRLPYRYPLQLAKLVVSGAGCRTR